MGEKKKDQLLPIANIKEQIKLYNNNDFIERPSKTFKIIKERAEDSVLNKANADVLLSLLMQRLIGADPDKSSRNDKSSDLRIQVGEYPVYEIKAQGGLMREERSPVITRDIMALFLENIIPPHIQKSMVEKKTAGRTDVDEDFSAVLNVNTNFDYNRKDEEGEKGTIHSQYSTKPQFLVENEGDPFATISRYRVNLTKSMGEMLLVIRKIDSEIPDFFDLGLNTRFLQFITYDRGLVLVTGPTGSGKSTTLAAIINEINKNYRKHIITLENPVEFVHKNNKSFFTQRDIPSDSQSFERAMKSALRQGPDIILFGEMRDPETIGGAIEAAETGHLVFGTLHTFNAAKTIDRLIGSFPIEGQNQIAQQLSTAFLGCISQTLVKTLDGGITALNEMVIGSDAISGAISENDSAKITQIAGSNPDEHLTMVEHALELIRTKRVSQNAVFGKIYRESKQTYKSLVEKLTAIREYNPDEDEYTPMALKKKEQDEINMLTKMQEERDAKAGKTNDKIDSNKKEDTINVKKGQLSEIGQIEEDLNRQEQEKKEKGDEKNTVNDLLI